MTGSAETATKHLADLKRFALETPFQFGDLVEYSKRLQAMGTETDDVVSVLRTLGNVAAGVGTEKLPQLILAFGQVQTTGRLMGTELKQFREAGVPILDELAKAYGTTTAKMEEMISEGKVGFESVRYALERMTEEGGRIGPQMQEQSRTFATAASNMTDMAFQVGADGFSPLFDWITDTAVELADFMTEEGSSWASTIQGNLLGVGNMFNWLGTQIHAATNLADQFGMAIHQAAAGFYDAHLAPPDEWTPPSPDNYIWEDDGNLVPKGEFFNAGLGQFGPAKPTAEDIKKMRADEAAAARAGRATKGPPPLLPARGEDKAKKAVEAAKEMLPVMEQLNRANAFEAFAEAQKKLLENGDRDAVIANFEAIGKTFDETARFILDTEKDIAREREQLREDELRAAEDKAAAEKRLLEQQIDDFTRFDAMKHDLDQKRNREEAENHGEVEEQKKRDAEKAAQEEVRRKARTLEQIEDMATSREDARLRDVQGAIEEAELIAQYGNPMDARGRLSQLLGAFSGKHAIRNIPTGLKRQFANAANANGVPITINVDGQVLGRVAGQYEGDLAALLARMGA